MQPVLCFLNTYVSYYCMYLEKCSIIYYVYKYCHIGAYISNYILPAHVQKDARALYNRYFNNFLRIKLELLCTA